MTSPITLVEIAGVALDLSDVEYQVNVQHGRNGVTNQPEASTAQITIRGASGVSAQMSDPVIIQAYGFDRFTGEISDLTITHLSTDPPTAITTVIAMGNLAKLGLRETTDTSYPHETVRERAEKILTDGGLTFLNGGNDVLELHSLSSSQTELKPVLDALAELAEWSGATYFDTPEGLISFESYGTRGLTAFASTWQSLVQPWTYYSQTWDSFPTTIATYTFPSSGVIWSPTWTQTLEALINDVTVTYGSTGQNEEQDDDAASIALYGRRAYRLDTRLRNSGDASDRAGLILTAQANPLWNMGQISVYVDLLGTTDRDRVLALINGATVTVPSLPVPAPYSSFQGIVEGWGETYTPGQHIITFTISDPRYSYQTVPWNLIDGALEWGDVNPTVAWYNVVNADDLLAA
jgi:hypothetical protein